MVNLVTFAGCRCWKAYAANSAVATCTIIATNLDVSYLVASIELDDDAAGLAFAQGNDASYAYRADQLDGPETGLASLPMAKLPENTTSEAQP